MTLVFVSYSNRDRVLALRLVDRLRAAAGDDLQVVIDDAIDADNPAIASDAYRLPFVGKRLRNAYAVVAVLTRSYAESDPCWLELSAALMMDKVVPINLDPGLSPAGIESMIGRSDIISVAPAWFDKEPGEVEKAETAKFEMFVRDLKMASARHRPFTDWPAAEPREVRPMTVQLAASLQPRAFRRTDLIWSPGSISTVQKKRFFAAIDSMAIATSETVWDVARRKALKGMAETPTDRRVRAEALMGLVGELTAPSDGSPPVTAHEPWEFAGDMALPIDRDISRFAYMRAGKIPNELRKMFQVLRPGRSKRRRIFALGALLGGVVGVVLAWGGQMLFGQLAPKAPTAPAPQPSEAPPQPSTRPAPPTQLAPSVPLQPETRPPEVAQLPPPQVQAPPVASQPPASTPFPPTTSPPVLTTFTVSGRGLEATVKAELERRGLDAGTWQETYGHVIDLNRNTLCSPERWKAAEGTGKKPLDFISSDTQLSWPTETDFEKPVRFQECPVWKIPT